MFEKSLASAAAATAICLLLAVVIDKTPAAVLAQTKGLACGRCAHVCVEGNARAMVGKACCGVFRHTVPLLILAIDTLPLPIPTSPTPHPFALSTAALYRGGLCPNGPAFIRKAGLTSAAEVEWAKVSVGAACTVCVCVRVSVSAICLSGIGRSCILLKSSVLC